MQLMVITREDFFGSEAGILNDLFEAGLEGLHLRKPGSTPHTVAALLRQIAPHFHPRIVVHRHTVLFDEFRLCGVHLPLPCLLRSEKMPDKGLVSCSAHTLPEIEAAAKVADRVFVSPVFDSLSKRGYPGNVSLHSISKPAGNTLCVALGGITPSRLATVRRYGFEAAAVMGYIWQGSRPQQRFEACRTAIAALTKRKKHEAHS